MPVSSGIQARFDHVDDTGELVFYADRSAFRVSVDDKLERAILEAKQIRSEALGGVQAHGEQTLPISRIQALIRAGEEPKNVADKYGLSEALVRRFAASVQTEKQYAIEQFLIVPAPKESKMHTVGDLVELTLAAAKVSMNSVTWSATRRGREPWRINAQFATKSGSVRAEWTWNMANNSVECRNSAAKVLFGETIKASAPHKADTVNQAEADGTNGIDSDTDEAPSVASLGRRTPETNQTQPRRMVGQATSYETVAPAEEAQSQPTESFEAQPADERIEVMSEPDTALPTEEIAAQTPQRRNGRIPEEPEDEPASAPSADNEPPAEGADAATDADTPQSADTATHGKEKHGKRKSGRSTIPSWDEILFGD